MNRSTSSRAKFALAAIATLSLAAAACGDDSDDAAPAATAAPAAPTTTAPMSETMSETMTDTGMSETMTDTGMSETMSETGMSETMTDTGMALEPSGPGCAAVPTDGPGSFAGMAADPAATAASNNPALSTLVAAVQQAGLVDTLNGDGPFTIFAPTNDAFAAIPKADLDAVLADQDLLTSILTYHVVAGESLSSQQLIDMGTVTTVNGGSLTITDDNGTLMVNGVASVCMDVPTANATVHIISGVLMPEG